MCVKDTEKESIIQNSKYTLCSQLERELGGKGWGGASDEHMSAKCSQGGSGKWVVDNNNKKHKVV